LTVTAYAGLDGGKNAQWHCDCDCGATAVVRGSRLRSGVTASCGCLRTNPAARVGVVRGDGSTSAEGLALYATWTAMRARCLSEAHPSYPRYGGRGIAICDRWLESFDDFVADMGPRPFKDAELDRRENDGPYSPDNCRWSTSKDNSRNRQNARVLDTPFGPMPMWQAAETFGLSANTLGGRLHRGWPASRLFEPLQRPGQARGRS
jgi:hypothetical protein